MLPLNCHCLLGVQNDTVYNSARFEKDNYYFFFLTDQDFLADMGMPSSSMTHTVFSAHHNSTAKSCQLSQYSSHTEIAPYEIFSAAFGTTSHESSALPSFWAAPRVNKVSLRVNGQAESNELRHWWTGLCEVFISQQYCFPLLLMFMAYLFSQHPPEWNYPFEFFETLQYSHAMWAMIIHCKHYCFLALVYYA